MSIEPQSQNEEWCAKVGLALQQLQRAGKYNQHSSSFLSQHSFNLLLLFIVFVEEGNWYLLVLLALGIMLGTYYIYKKISIKYITDHIVIDDFLANAERFRTVTMLDDDEMVEVLSVEKIAEGIKRFIGNAIKSVEANRKVALMLRLHSVLLWLGGCGVVISLLLLLINYLLNNLSIASPLAYSDSSVEMLCKILAVLFISLLGTFDRTFTDVVLNKIRSHINPSLLPDGSARISGSLNNRMDLAHHNQHSWFFLGFWLYGLAPLALCIFLWAIGLADNPWTSVPALLATAAALVLGATELFRWRHELGTVLADSGLAAQVIELSLAGGQPGQRYKSPWRRLIESIEAPPDPAVETAFRMADKLRGQLPAAVRQAAGQRIQRLAAYYLAVELACAALLWQLVGSQAGGIATYLIALILGGLHLAILLTVVRRSFPVVAMLEYLKANL